MTQLGKYKILTLLGSGTFAEVYKAQDLELHRIVALKVLKPALLADTDAFGRFTQEARVAAGLFHPHIATVLDMGQADGRTYFAMRYVDGPSLDAVLRERGPLPWGEALTVMQQIGAALGFAHQRGIIHRDVKPSNILLSREPGEGAVLSDFGLVKAVSASAVATSSHTTIGTPQYIPPEVWHGKLPAPAVDQYALACVLVELLTGKALFDGATPPAVMAAHFQPPRLPQTWPAEVPEGFTDWIAKALAPEPEQRYTDMEAFIQALTQAAVVAPSQQQPQSVDPKAVEIQLQADRDRTERDRQQAAEHARRAEEARHRRQVWWQRNAKWLALGTVAVLVLFGLSQWIPFLINSLQSTQPPQVSPQDGMQMLYVPAGEFWMGTDKSTDSQAQDDELPQHRVNLDAYWIDQTEVTNAMYARCVADGACTPPAETRSYTRNSYSYYGSSRFDNYPVIYVDWNQANAYCAWARRRLPTEAEWEKAARGTDKRIYPWGDEAPNAKLVNYAQPAKDTMSVGSFPSGASPYGALDMAGNVWEWVADVYGKDYYQNSTAANPAGPKTGGSHVLRGGSWNNVSFSLRAANRDWSRPDFRINFIGFRCAQSAHTP